MCLYMLFYLMDKFFFPMRNHYIVKCYVSFDTSNKIQVLLSRHVLIIKLKFKYSSPKRSKSNFK